MNQASKLEEVVEVRQVSQEKANELLSNGKWTLLGVSDGKTQAGAQDVTPFFEYSIGRYK